MRPTITQNSYKNRLLASLPMADILRLAPHLSLVTLKRNQILQDAGQPVETVYFLEDGICSTVVALENGTTVEVGVTGREGFVGVPALLGAGHSPNSSFMQIPGHGFSVKARTLVEQSDTSRELRLCLQRSIQGHQVQIEQTAACNRVHELDERLARWLLNPPPAPADGDSNTINVSWSNPSNGSYRVTNIPSMRMVAALGDPDGLLIIGPLGQSGHPGHRHYDDMTRMWQEGKLVRVPLTEEGIRGATQEKLVLSRT